MPVDARSLVNTKNGKRDGTRTFAQTDKPLNATVLYFAGFMAIKMIISNRKMPKKNDSFGIFNLLCLTRVFIFR